MTEPSKTAAADGRADATERLSLLPWALGQAGAGRQVWAVLDASAELTKREVAAIDRAQPAFNLLAHRTSDPAALAIAPRLIGMPDGQIPLVFKRLWLQQPADEPAIFFVSTPCGEQDFAEAMRRRVRARLPDGEVMLLRWWDARVWWALHQLPLAEHPEVAAFWGVIAESAWLSRDGALQTSSFFAEGGDTMAEQTHVSLGQLTFDRLMDLGAADAVLGICRAQYPGVLDMVMPEQRHDLACQQMGWAEREGFKSPEDQALAVRIAAEVGWDWHEQAEWRELIVAARTHDITLVAAAGAM